MTAVPLSHQMSHDGWVFTSGQIGRRPDETIPVEFGDQMRAALDSLSRHLEAAGASLETVSKTTVFLTRRDDFAEMNEGYTHYFRELWPARSTIVADMVRPELVFEIEAIAHRRTP
jgi:2-iminobutanoate/2-iminopropanoate deaminase